MKLPYRLLVSTPREHAHRRHDITTNGWLIELCRKFNSCAYLEASCLSVGDLRDRHHRLPRPRGDVERQNRRYLP